MLVDEINAAGGVLGQKIKLFLYDDGGDPNEALRLARLNFEVRKTSRAHELLSRAISANEAAVTTFSSMLPPPCDGSQATS